MLTLKELELLHIFDCLKKNYFVKSDTADELGISRRTLSNKMNELESMGHIIPDRRMKSSQYLQRVEKYYVQGMATNEERLAHADSMINRNYL